MRIALELNETECEVLIDILTQKILKAEAYRDTHVAYWTPTDDDVLAYKIKLRNKIQEFRDIQEHLSIGRED